MTKQIKRLFKLSGALNLALLIALSAMSAGAATLTFSDTISLTITDWDDSFSITKFDSATYGNLTKVELFLTGDVEGSIGVESKDTAPRTITANLSASITADPNLGFPALVVVVTPAVNQTFNASPFDGVIDFGGTSGKTFPNLTGTKSASKTTTLASEMAGFLGAGQLLVLANATGTSGATGSGNVTSDFTTLARAELTVRYTYDPKEPPNEIPEPATYAMMGAGLAGLAFLRRRAAK